MINAFLLFVPLSFAIIHFLEYSAIMARIAGIQSKSHMTGYTIQQAVYVGTRLFIVALLPMLGFIVDSKIPQTTYQLMAASGLIGAAILSLIAFYMRATLISYYVHVIKKYRANGNFASSFFSIPDEILKNQTNMFQQVIESWRNAEGRRIICQSAAVFAIYGTGVFISFYAALANFEYRASISQLSGIINSIGTVLLTFYVEPAISRGIDSEREDAQSLVYSLLIGRFFGIAILSQMLLVLAFLLI